MHQAVVVKVGESWQLMVAGGKNRSNSDNVDHWFNSVEMLDLNPYFKKDLTFTDVDGLVKPLESKWR